MRIRRYIQQYDRRPPDDCYVWLVSRGTGYNGREFSLVVRSDIVNVLDRHDRLLSPAVVAALEKKLGLQWQRRSL